LNYISKLKK